MVEKKSNKNVFETKLCVVHYFNEFINEIDFYTVI